MNSGLAGVRIAVLELEIRFRKRISAKGVSAITLDSIPKKVNARVVAVDAFGSGGLRLMEMGIVPGTLVRVVNCAPLGDPVRVFVKGYQLALRREEARSIHVTLCDE